MKILLIGFSKIKYMPYANFYLENIDSEKHDVHLLYWNRDMKQEATERYKNITLHEFCYYQEDDVPQIAKIPSFLKFVKFAKGVLNENAFDFVILLHSMPGVLLYRTWTKRFHGRYVFDYRDSTYERFDIYNRIIAKLIQGSRATFTSSDGFRKFFPEAEQHKVYTSHNILIESLLHRDIVQTPHDRIRVSFWGMVREEQLNCDMIRQFAQDQRFELHYYGREQEVALRLKAYAQGIQAQNVYFHGEYKPEERYDFARETDLIHNLYCGDNAMLAMGNKYYDGVIFHIPQLCFPGSFMGNQVQEKGIGFACDPVEENFTDDIYAYYMQLNREHFVQRCDEELAYVLKQYQEGVNILRVLF